MEGGVGPYNRPMPRTPERWRERLRRFADEECKDSSRLYEVLSLGMADDAEVLGLLAEVANPRAQPTLPLAAVHYLLLGAGGIDSHGLARFYPNLTAVPDAFDRAYPAFRAFVLAERERLAPLLATRGTQTNEVGRCSFLFPAYVIAAARTGKRLCIVDVGSSAGLTLLFDRYAYDYDGVVAGDAASTVRIRTRMRGARAAIAPMPTIVDRVGIDLAPIAADDADAVRWLEACVWPEHVERFANLRAALSIARAVRPRVIRGNAVDVLSELIARTDRDAALVVVNTAVMLYMSRDERARYVALLAHAGATRDVLWIANEHPVFLREAGFALREAGFALREPGFAAPLESERDPAELPVVMTHWHHGRRDDLVLGWVGPHARWLDWIGAPAD